MIDVNLIDALTSNNGGAISGKIQVNGHLNIAVMGASVMYGAFDALYSLNALATEQLFEDNGYRIKVLPFAVGGNKSASTLAATPNAIEQLGYREGYSVAALHTGGNDVTSAYQGYPTDADLIASNINGIFDLFSASSIPVIASPISYRVPPASNPVEQYNENDVLPIIESKGSEWWNSPVKFDLYTLLYDNQQWLVDDGIHPNEEGAEAIRELLLSVIKSGSNYNPPQDTNGIEEAIIKFSPPDLYYDNFMGLYRNNVTPTSGNVDVYNKDLTKVIDGYVYIDGYVPSDRSGLVKSSSFELNLYSSAITKDFIYSSSPFSIMFSESCFNPASTYTVRVTACRAVDSTTRVGEYTVGGVMKVLDAATPTEQDQEIIEWTGVLGSDLIASGLSVNVQDGSSNAYLSGIEIIKE